MGRLSEEKRKKKGKVKMKWNETTLVLALVTCLNYRRQPNKSVDLY